MLIRISTKLFTVGFDIPDDDVVNIPFRSDQSLLDADIIVFEPSFFDSYHSSEYYNGKRLLDQSDSFRIAEDVSHWKSELKAAFDSDKTIFIYLSSLEEVFRYTGEKQFSGTGRNRLTTTVVTPLNNYDALPLRISRVVPKSGTEIRVAKDLGILATYWKEFASESRYEVYLEGPLGDVVLTTKAGNKIVGAIIGRDKTRGTMILLPPLRFDPEPLFTKSGRNWNAKGIAFGKRLTSIFIEIDKAARGERQSTPPPDWTKASIYRLASEGRTEAEIRAVSNQIEELQLKRARLTAQLDREGGLRRLLYERGVQLEEATLDALRILGFKAEHYKEGESEFDAIFVSDEGRFLGEAEGKDNKAINVDKLSQLERNIQEDFARDEVVDFAKGVLFGNPHRLVPPEERPDYFTAKCISGAKRLKIALVRTPDLFPISKYLKEQDDASFAKACREAILNTEGEIVRFPAVPTNQALEATGSVTRNANAVGAT